VELWIILPNSVAIGRTVTEMLQFFDF